MGDRNKWNFPRAALEQAVISVVPSLVGWAILIEIGSAFSSDRRFLPMLLTDYMIAGAPFGIYA